MTKAEALATLGPDERELYEERAAIREYEGNQPREAAENAALREVLAGRKRSAP